MHVGSLMRTMSPTMTASIEHARAALTAGRFTEAVAACRELVSEDPGSSAAHVTLALAHQGLEQYDEAWEAVNTATALAPDCPEALEALGRIARDKSLVDDAHTAFRMALAADPHRASTWANLGQLQLNASRFTDAETSLREALELDPELGVAWTDLCWVLRRLGRHGEAVVAGRNGLQLAPGDDAYNYLIFALLAADHRQEALETCVQSLSVNPRNVATLAHMPAALDGVGRRDEGCSLADFNRLMLMAELRSAEGYASLGDFNRELGQYLIDFPNRPFDTKQTRDLMVDPRGPIIPMRKIINDYTYGYLDALPDEPGHPFLAHKPKRWRIDAWGTRATETDVEEHHFHQHAWVSGVYYVKLPAFISSAQENRSGWIEFSRFNQYSERNVDTEFMTISPTEGLLVLFPSYFYHRVVPFQSNEMRISLAFNIIPED